MPTFEEIFGQARKGELLLPHQRKRLPLRVSQQSCVRVKVTEVLVGLTDRKVVEKSSRKILLGRWGEEEQQ